MRFNISSPSSSTNLLAILLSFFLATILSNSLALSHPTAESALYERGPPKGGAPKSPGGKKLPTYADCKKAVKVSKDKALFWSGTGEALPNEIARTMGLQMDSTAYPRGFTKIPSGTSITEERKFQDDFSKAYAEAASGKVYVLVPPGGPNPTRVFASVEYPALKSNKKVTQILQIDPKTKKVAGPYKPTFKRHLGKRFGVDLEKRHGRY